MCSMFFCMVFHKFDFLSLFLRASEMNSKGNKTFKSVNSIEWQNKSKRQNKTKQNDVNRRLMFIDFRPLNQMLKLIALSNTFRIMMNYGLFHRSIQSSLFLCSMFWVWFLWSLFSLRIDGEKTVGFAYIYWTGYKRKCNVPLLLSPSFSSLTFSPARVLFSFPFASWIAVVLLFILFLYLDLIFVKTKKLNVFLQSLYVFFISFSRRLPRHQLWTKYRRLSRKSLSKRWTMYWWCERVSLQMLAKFFGRILWEWHWRVHNSTVGLPEWCNMYEHDWRLLVYLREWMDGAGL